MKKLINIFLVSLVLVTANCFASDGNTEIKNHALLKKMGIGLEVPVKTRMVIKYLIKSGMSASGALEALNGGIDFATANAITIAGHPKVQEMEADSIALELIKRINLDVTNTACEMFAGDKEAGIFDQHPSYANRRANLGCSK